MRFVIAAFVASMVLALLALSAPSQRKSPEVNEASVIRVVSRAP